MADEIVTVDSVTLKLPDAVQLNTGMQAAVDAKAPAALTNLVTNPGPASATDWTSNDGSLLPTTYLAGEIKCERATGAAGLVLVNLYRMGLTSAQILPVGSTWQRSIDIKPPVNAHVTFQTSGGFPALPSQLLPAGVWTRVTDYVVGTGASTWPLAIVVSADADPGAGGVFTYLRKSMLVQAPPTPIVPYFDGSSAGARWTGAAGASTSIGPGVPGSVVDLSTPQILANKVLNNATSDSLAPFALTNLCTNPGPASLAGNAWYTVDAAKWALTYAAGEIRAERLAGATGFTLLNNAYDGLFNVVMLPAGSMWQASIEVKPPVDSHTTNTGAPYGFPPGIALPANVWTRITSYLVGAGVAGYPTALTVEANADPGVGGVFTYLRRSMLVQAPPTPIVPYFDGNSPGARWTGTANASTSIGPGVPGSVVDLSSPQTLANKRITPRVFQSVVTNGLAGPPIDIQDVYITGALTGNLTFDVPAGTPTDGQRFRIRFKDNGTARALFWNAIYRSAGGLLPATTVAGKQMYLEFIYNAADVKWDLLSLGVQDRSGVDVQTFLANGTWVKPPGVTTVQVIVVSSGGGGGSGRRGAAGTVRCGGGGGGGGGLWTATLPAAVLPATVAATVATGGLGGAAVTTDNTDGNSGSSSNTACKFGDIQTWYGGPGGGGTATGGTGGTGLGVNGFSVGTLLGMAGLSASAVGGGGSSLTVEQAYNAGARGAPSGGGITAGNSPYNGGNGAVIWGGTAVPGGVVDGALPSRTGADHLAGSGLPGAVGGGGAASITQAAQAGADGGAYGGGGAGGGASLNGFASGKGGNGGPGICIVTSW